MLCTFIYSPTQSFSSIWYAVCAIAGIARWPRPLRPTIVRGRPGADSSSIRELHFFKVCACKNYPLELPVVWISTRVHTRELVHYRFIDWIIDRVIGRELHGCLFYLVIPMIAVTVFLTCLHCSTCNCRERHFGAEFKFPFSKRNGTEFIHFLSPSNFSWISFPIITAPDGVPPFHC